MLFLQGHSWQHFSFQIIVIHKLEAYYCSTKIGVHIHAKHAFFEYNLEERQTNAEVNFHMDRSHVVHIRRT